METSMLTHPTHERLITLGLTGMAKALEEQRRSPDLDALSFEERVGLLVDREAAERDTKRLTTRLKFAALRQSACVEDVDLRTPRGIDRAVFARLVGGDWIDRNENLLITGATGLGKSWIACALGHKACRDNRSVQYHRVPRLFEALALARGDGRYGRLLKTIGRVQLLILDDWGLSVLNPPERRDLLEILDDRHGRASTIVTSQIPVEHWHDIIGDPTLGDAILDRLVHNAHRLQLTGESMRKQNARNQTLDASLKPLNQSPCRSKRPLMIARNTCSRSREIAAHHQRNAHQNARDLVVVDAATRQRTYALHHLLMPRQRGHGIDRQRDRQLGS